jgi:hypothetical protein
MATDDREKALEAALAQIDKQYGKGSVMRLGDEVRAPIEIIPTGSIALDVALGIGGLPRGRVVEIYGPESSGKTTVALHAIANAQAEGGICAFIDAEHALDPEYAGRLGVDTDSLLVSQPDNGEQALEIADMLIRSGALTLIVITSGGDRGGDGRQPCRSSGTAHEPGPSKDDRCIERCWHDSDLHQPASGEDRGDVRVARDNDRRPSTQVLRIRATRRASNRDTQRWTGNGRQSDAREGGQKQSGAAI